MKIAVAGLLLTVWAVFSVSAGEPIADGSVETLTISMNGESSSFSIYRGSDTELKKNAKRVLTRCILLRLFTRNEIVLKSGKAVYRKQRELLRDTRNEYYRACREQLPFFDALAGHILRMAELKMTSSEYFNRYLADGADRISAGKWTEHSSPGAIDWAKEFSACTLEEKVGMLYFNGIAFPCKTYLLSRKLRESSDPDGLLQMQLKALDITVPDRWKPCLDGALANVRNVTRLKQSDEIDRKIEQMEAWAKSGGN